MSSLINDSAVPDKLVQDACQFPDYPETFVATVQVACYYRGTEKKKKKKTVQFVESVLRYMDLGVAS